MGCRSKPSDGSPNARSAVGWQGENLGALGVTFVLVRVVVRVLEDLVGRGSKADQAAGTSGAADR
jgi:hypothetical protein